MAKVSSITREIAPAVTERVFNIELTQDEANELFSILYSGVTASRLKDIGLTAFAYALQDSGAKRVRRYLGSLNECTIND